MRYLYRNEADCPINICGYQFAVNAEISSNIIIARFEEFVREGFLSLREAAADDGSKSIIGEAEKSAETGAEELDVKPKAQNAVKIKSAKKNKETAVS
jgi:hypothetical protein